VLPTHLCTLCSNGDLLETSEFMVLLLLIRFIIPSLLSGTGGCRKGGGGGVR
jgi:hypothetical protein